MCVYSVYMHVHACMCTVCVVLRVCVYTLYVCMYMHVCVQYVVHVHTCVCSMGMCVCINARHQHWVSSSVTAHFVLERVSLNLGLTDSLASKLQESSCLPLPRTGITDEHSGAWLCKRVLGISTLVLTSLI